MPLFSWNHFTLLDPRNCSTLLESKNYSIKEQLFFFFLKPGNYSILLEPWLEPRNYSTSLKSRSYSIFVGFVFGTRELLSFFFFFNWNLRSPLESRISSALLGSRITSILLGSRISQALLYRS